MRTSMWLASAALLLAPVGCDSDSGAVGAPCNTADDCQGDLICDVHNGQGSCQEPHGHTAGESDTDSDDASTSSDTTDPATSTTADPSESSSGTTADESTGPSETSSTTDASETSGDTALCEAFCGCMAATCSGYDAYPYADEAACLDACAAFDEPTLACYGSFCQQATDSEGTLVEHYCEHAWGALGNEKC